jgi:AraC-like DNA-binding protein
MGFAETECDADPVGAGAPVKSGVEVWDTQYLPPSQAFGTFRDAFCSAFMPWTIDCQSEGDFEGRIESASLDRGTIARVRVTPVVASRTKSNIANSSGDCVYGNFILAGELDVEQRGRSCVAKQGDVILYDSSSPTTLRKQHASHYQNVPFMIPKSYFSEIPELETFFGNIVLRRDSLIRPFSSTLTFLADNILTLSRAEQTALFDACVSLLPIAVSHSGRSRKDGDDLAQANHVLREILDFVSRNLSDVDLSPRSAAESFDISVRYVHKLFATKGTTFGSYVASKRLDQIRKDLISPSCRKQPISIVAYRWGFNDLTTFNRTFKQRYGVTPSQCRAIGN